MDDINLKLNNNALRHKGLDPGKVKKALKLKLVIIRIFIEGPGRCKKGAKKVQKRCKKGQSDSEN